MKRWTGTARQRITGAALSRSSVSVLSIATTGVDELGRALSNSASFEMITGHYRRRSTNRVTYDCALEAGEITR